MHADEPFGGFEFQSHEARQKNLISVKQLKKGKHVDLNVEPMFIFHPHDGMVFIYPAVLTHAEQRPLHGMTGTVISIHPTPNLAFTSPITNGLRQRDTGLRMSADPSLLVQSLLDLSMSPSSLAVVFSAAEHGCCRRPSDSGSGRCLPWKDSQVGA
jgi:hypothetical protein